MVYYPWESTAVELYVFDEKGKVLAHRRVAEDVYLLEVIEAAKPDQEATILLGSQNALRVFRLAQDGSDNKPTVKPNDGHNSP